MAKEKGTLSDAQYQERVRQLKRRRVAQDVEDWRALMGQPWGRRLLYRAAFERGRLHGSSFHGHQKDGLSNALCSAHAEGRRALAGELIAEVQKHCMPQYLKMLGEQMTEREEALLLEQQAANASEDQDDAS